MKVKAKIAMMAGASFLLMGVMQVSHASTETKDASTVFELTEENMDGITAGAKAKARARARSRGTRSASTSAVTSTNGRSTRAVAISTATGNRASARARASATGDVVRTRGANRSGRYYSVAWRVSYGYNR